MAIKKVNTGVTITLNPYTYNMLQTLCQTAYKTKTQVINDAIENYYINYPFNHLKGEDETIESLEYCTKGELKNDK